MIQWHFAPRVRHPLLRLVAGLLGALVLAGLVALGLFAVAALAAVGAVLVLLRRLRGRPIAAASARPPSGGPPEGIIEGEYTIVHETTPRR